MKDFSRAENLYKLPIKDIINILKKEGLPNVAKALKRIHKRLTNPN